MKNIFKVDGKYSIKALIISILIPFIGSGLSSFISGNSKNIYDKLVKPPFAPPGFIFGIVWTILYLLMGIAAYRIYMKKKNDNSLFFYSIQLLLNFLWPIIFFGFRLYGLAFFELIILFIFIFITTYKFYKVDKISGIFMMPYLLWTLFAGALNFSIWYFNEM